MFVSTSRHCSCTLKRFLHSGSRHAHAAALVSGANRLSHSPLACSASSRRVLAPDARSQHPAWSAACPSQPLSAHRRQVCDTLSDSGAVPRPPRACSAGMATLAVPANFEAVMAVVVASFFLHHIFMAFSVGKARKQFGVKYPDLYATTENCPKEEDAKAFNCIQRGHQNSLEFQPIFLSLLVCAGLKNPVTAAIAGFVTLVGRLIYFTGYSTGVPNNRLKGSVVALLGTFVILGAVVKSVAVWGMSLMA
eukprot:jgi/Ulvmu1/3242/UM150_0015.1